ncbi:uncharacterized protein CANTADRAFT_191105 [Suhomyces tanzawaensis NRRL Y-17324]|uniref:Uncharacterized protein n=1 Tax=Suhomyces tanzawaensis NRRL Y-17324 TaxID=984487 RepID=A0A1E4SNQ5_9ASCO|nr:uncharacterized protein CANTADRAFT_191105 [Suhomyces tanzawaensis NRRL Y-17324]ODV81149.1 hypothetical protein CANTADRAFT_191105 [Suhomyces tanzawaensis NRRL Y-17324]
MSDKPLGTFASSRKNSLTSLSTLNTSASAAPSTHGSARSLSTDNLLSLDDKFIKKSIKKVPSNVQPAASPILASTDGFHKTNGGTYYFPNGEIFRPRLTPLKRNRPSKVTPSPQLNSRANSLNTQSTAPQHQLQSLPVASSSASSHSSYSLSSNSASQDSVIPRNSSLQSLHTLPSPALPSVNPVTGLQKSSSYNNIKQLNKQNLVKNIRSNKLDTPTNISLNSGSDSPYLRSNSMLSNVSSPFNSNSRQNSLTNTVSSSSARYNYPQGGFNNHNQNLAQLQKLQSNNILKASDANSSSTSFSEYGSSGAASPTNGSDSKNDDQVLLQTQSAGSNYSDGSNSSSSSAYSTSSTASVSVTTTDPSSVTSNANLNRSMSNTPTTSIDDSKMTNTLSSGTNNNSGPSTPEKNIAFKDIKDIRKQYESPNAKGLNSIDEPLENAPKENVKDEPTTDLQANVPVNAPSSDSDDAEDDGNLSTLNEVSEENLSKTTTNATESKTHQSEPSPSTTKVYAPTLTINSKIHSDDDLLFSTPVTSPTGEHAPTLPSSNLALHLVGNQNRNVQSHPLRMNLDRTESVLPDPTIEDDSFDRQMNIAAVHVKEQLGESTPKKDRSHDKSFHNPSPSVSKPTTPKNTKFFDFHPDDKFNNFLNDDQAEVPPRGDLVVISGQKIRKHDRASSSISSFNSIINNEVDSPISPNGATSPPLTPGQFSKGQLSTHSPRPSSPLHRIDASGPHSPLPAPTPTAFLHGAHDDLRPPTAFKEHDNLSAQSSLHLYSIHEGSKTSIASQPQLRSMLDVAGVKPDVKPPKPPTTSVGSNSAGSASEPRLDSPQKVLKSKSKSKSMSNLSPHKPITNVSPQKPKSNLKSFFKKMFSSTKSPKVSSSEYNTTQETDFETEVDSRSVNVSNILDSKSIKSGSYYSMTGSHKEPATDLKSQHSSNSNKYKRSFSLGNLKTSKISSKFVSRKAAPEPIPKPLPEPLRLTPRPDSVFMEPVLTKLPSIEREDSMFDEMMLTFDEKLTESEQMLDTPLPQNILTSRPSVKDPFLKDDELTSAQIKDQQLRDGLADDEAIVSVDSNPRFSRQGRPMSEEVYIDDNIRFLQKEFNWSNIDDSDLSTIDETSDILPVSYLIPAPTGDGPIVVTNDQLNLIFSNLSDFQRRNLPGHLKYIKQFKDYKFVEIAVKNFEDLENTERTTELESPSSSILKRGGEARSGKKVIFSHKISINETFAPDMYKRYNKSVTQYTLTESHEINNIKNELNNYKCNEMLVHENSQNNTHFFY